VNRRAGCHDQEDQGHDHVRGEVERCRLIDLRLPEDFDHADVRHQDGVLLKSDEVVEKGRDYPPDGLRQDDVAKRLKLAETERSGRGLLARVDRLDSRSVNLRHIGRIHKRQGDDRVEEWVGRYSRDPETGDAKPRM